MTDEVSGDLHVFCVEAGRSGVSALQEYLDASGLGRVSAVMVSDPAGQAALQAAVGDGSLAALVRSRREDAAPLPLPVGSLLPTGDPFFSIMAQGLTTLSRCEESFIARVIPEKPDWIEIISAVEEGGLRGSFCAPAEHPVLTEVMQGRPFLQEQGAWRAYPDALLQKKRIEGCAVFPLLGVDGSLLGLAGVMSRQPLRGTRQLVSLMQVVGVSVAAELERQKSQRRYEDLFEFSPDGLLMTDHQGIIKMINRRAEVLFGWSRDALLGQPIEVLIPDQHRERHRHFRGAFLNDMQHRPMGKGRANLQGLRRDGTVFPVEISLGPVQTAEGMMVATAVRDVSQRKRLEQQIHRAQWLDSIVVLAGGIAHDLNNALTPVVMALSYLMEDYPQERATLEAIESGVGRAVGMVRQLVSFARGNHEQVSPVSMGALIQEMGKIIRLTFPAHVQIRIQEAPGLFLVQGDATRLHQVLLNLCVNARDAMEGGGQLSLGLRSTAVDATFASCLEGVQPGPFVVLRVADTGAGIPLEIQDRIFDPFFTTKGPDRGTGLGLFTVLQIVRSHGGFVQMESQPGQGTMFDIYLPALSCAESAPEAVVEEPVFEGRGEIVLYVDDEPSIREHVGRILARLGLRVLMAADGADALILAARRIEEISLVITDVSMPHMDGLTLIRTLRRLRMDLPIIVATGRLEPRQERELDDLHVHLVLQKPFHKNDLVYLLRRALYRNADQ